jgi:hypothetical protein
MMDDRYDGCPICQSWADGRDGSELLIGQPIGKAEITPGLAIALVATMREPHMALCAILGIRHNHPDIY